MRVERMDEDIEADEKTTYAKLSYAQAPSTSYQPADAYQQQQYGYPPQATPYSRSPSRRQYTQQWMQQQHMYPSYASSPAPSHMSYSGMTHISMTSDVSMQSATTGVQRLTELLPVQSSASENVDPRRMDELYHHLVTAIQMLDSPEHLGRAIADLKVLSHRMTNMQQEQKLEILSKVVQKIIEFCRGQRQNLGVVHHLLRVLYVMGKDIPTRRMALGIFDSCVDIIHIVLLCTRNCNVVALCLLDQLTNNAEMVEARQFLLFLANTHPQSLDAIAYRFFNNVAFNEVATPTAMSVIYRILKINNRPAQAEFGVNLMKAIWSVVLPACERHRSEDGIHRCFMLLELLLKYPNNQRILGNSQSVKYMVELSTRLSAMGLKQPHRIDVLILMCVASVSGFRLDSVDVAIFATSELYYRWCTDEGTNRVARALLNILGNYSSANEVKIHLVRQGAVEYALNQVMICTANRKLTSEQSFVVEYGLFCINRLLNATTICALREETMIGLSTGPFRSRLLTLLVIAPAIVQDTAIVCMNTLMMLPSFSTGLETIFDEVGGTNIAEILFNLVHQVVTKGPSDRDVNMFTFLYHAFQLVNRICNNPDLFYGFAHHTKSKTPYFLINLLDDSVMFRNESDIVMRLKEEVLRTCTFLVCDTDIRELWTSHRERFVVMANHSNSAIAQTASQVLNRLGVQDSEDNPLEFVPAFLG